MSRNCRFYMPKNLCYYLLLTLAREQINLSRINIRLHYIFTFSQVLLATLSLTFVYGSLLKVLKYLWTALYVV